MKSQLQKLLFLVIGLSLAATASYLNAWTGPPAGTPPANNVSAPVNISALSQIKLGGLSVASLLSTGAIGASQYCDASGQNCATPPLGGAAPVPAGAVMAFNLTTCPAGWIPADGTNGTRDLRGYFVRGLNTSTTGVDPNRVLGSIQADAFKTHIHTGVTDSAGSHTHTYSGPQGDTSSGLQSNSGTYSSFEKDKTTLNTGSSGAHTHTLTLTANTDGGGTETRPKNIALLYCQKT